MPIYRKFQILWVLANIFLLRLFTRFVFKIKILVECRDFFTKIDVFYFTLCSIPTRTRCNRCISELLIKKLHSVLGYRTRRLPIIRIFRTILQFFLYAGIENLHNPICFSAIIGIPKTRACIFRYWVHTCRKPSLRKGFTRRNILQRLQHRTLAATVFSNENRQREFEF